MIAIAEKSLKVGQYVNSEHVNTVVRNYKQERWIHNSRHIGKEDSLSTWYSVEELEEYIEMIKSHGADGIRFYFAAYPANYEKKPEYAGRQTVVLVATKNRDLNGENANKDLYITDGEQTKVLAYNMGTICPPVCPTTKPTGPDEDWGGIGTTLVDRGNDGLAIV